MSLLTDGLTESDFAEVRKEMCEEQRLVVTWVHFVGISMEIKDP